MNCFYIYFAVLFVGSQAGVINWAKHDSRLLGNQTDLQQDYPEEVIANNSIEGSGIEPNEQNDQPKIEICQNGWLRFENSCYFVERNGKATFEEAKKECEKKSGKLFTPNSDAEYNELMDDTALFSHTWTGLSKKNEAEPKWQAETQFDHKKINWLVKPFSASSNGFSSVSQCVAFHNGNIDATKYNYFYPCDWKFLYICEKNAVVPFI